MFNFISICTLTCFPFAFSVPLNTLYSEFVKDLHKNNCELSSQIKLPLNSIEVQNSSSLESYLTICNNADSSTVKNETIVMCKEVLGALKNIYCLPKDSSLPEIKVDISKQVCTDLNSEETSDHDTDDLLLKYLQNKLLCEFICDEQKMKACQILLWSHKVQHQINTALINSKDNIGNEKPDAALINSKDNIVNEKHDAKQVFATAQTIAKSEAVGENHNAESKLSENKDVKDNKKEIKVALDTKNESKDNRTLVKDTTEPSVSENNSGVQQTIDIDMSPQSNSNTKDSNATLTQEVTSSQIIANPNQPVEKEQVSLNNASPVPIEEEDPHDSHPEDSVNDDHVEEAGENTNDEANDLQNPNAGDYVAPHDNHVDVHNIDNEIPDEVSNKAVISLDTQPQDMQDKVKELEVSKTVKETSSVKQNSETPSGNTNEVVSTKEDLTNPATQVKLTEVTTKEKQTTSGNLKSITQDKSLLNAEIESMDEDKNKIKEQDGAKILVNVNKGAEEYGDTENDDDGEYKQDYGGGLYEPQKNVPETSNFESNIKIKEPSTVRSKDQDEFSSRNAFVQEQIDFRTNPAAFPETEDSHFFFYFLSIVMVLMGGYLIFHNKQKIIALIVEGRHERRRRSHGASYKKLETK